MCKDLVLCVVTDIKTSEIIDLNLFCTSQVCSYNYY